MKKQFFSVLLAVMLIAGVASSAVRKESREEILRNQFSRATQDVMDCYGAAVVPDEQSHEAALAQMESERLLPAFSRTAGGGGTSGDVVYYGEFNRGVNAARDITGDDFADQLNFFAPWVQRPLALGFSETGELGVTNSWGKLFILQDKNGDHVADSGNTFVPGFAWAGALAFDSHGEILVGTELNGTVLQYRREMENRLSMGDLFTNRLGLSANVDFAYDSRGDLFSVDPFYETIVKVSDPANGDWDMDVFADVPAPVAMAFDRNDDLYVVSAAHWVQDENGNWTQELGNILRLRDNDGDGYAEDVVTVSENWDFPYSPFNAIRVAGERVYFVYKGEILIMYPERGYEIRSFLPSFLSGAEYISDIAVRNTATAAAGKTTAVRVSRSH